jgi:hypothetical protein
MFTICGHLQALEKAAQVFTLMTLRKPFRDVAEICALFCF